MDKVFQLVLLHFHRKVFTRLMIEYRYVDGARMMYDLVKIVEHTYYYMDGSEGKSGLGYSHACVCLHYKFPKNSKVPSLCGF